MCRPSMVEFRQLELFGYSQGEIALMVKRNHGERPVSICKIEKKTKAYFKVIFLVRRASDCYRPTLS